MLVGGILPPIVPASFAATAAKPKADTQVIKTLNPDSSSAEVETLKDWYSAGTAGGAKHPDSKPAAQRPAPITVSPKGTTGGSSKPQANAAEMARLTEQREEELRLLMLDKQPTDLKQIADQIIAIRPKVTDEPSVAILRFRVGTYLYLLGDFEAAANELKAAVNLQPNNALARAQLAKILEISGDHQEALNQFRKAVELAPNVSAIHFLFAESLLHGGNMSEGINEYRKAITLKQEPESYCGLSEALLFAGDAQGAMKAARQAVSLEPSMARAQIALTNALLKNGDQQSSLRTARQAALLNPNLPESHLALGRCLFTKGDITGAVDEFRQAVALDPLNFQARNDLGYALYGKGDIPNAITEFRLALRINPRFTEARNNLEVAVHRLHADDKH
jgi:Flp pilus assembly protein TadD